MVAIVEHRAAWRDGFDAVAVTIAEATGDDVRRIDHIGSTAVPGLPAKDVIDVQVTVADEASLERVAGALAARGWRRVEPVRDHHVPGLSDDVRQWHKAFLREPLGQRAVHVHVRIEGRANQRYAVLFRDYLRAHPEAAAAYALVKHGLAALAPDRASYADAKDPVCDLIYRAAEEWAGDTGWSPP